MTDTPRPDRIVRMTCDACGARMNPHAEKPAVPAAGSDSLQADWVLGGIVEEIHQCPSCGRTQTRRAR